MCVNLNILAFATKPHFFLHFHPLKVLLALERCCCIPALSDSLVKSAINGATQLTFLCFITCTFNVNEAG